MVRAVAVAALVAIAVTGCGDDGEDGTVTIRDRSFDPDEITVAAGETVTWQWDDGDTEHSVVGFAFEERPRAEGTFTHTFDEPGSYDYACTIHPDMRGRVVVTADG